MTPLNGVQTPFKHYCNPPGVPTFSGGFLFQRVKALGREMGRGGDLFDSIMRVFGYYYNFAA